MRQYYFQVTCISCCTFRLHYITGETPTHSAIVVRTWVRYRRWQWGLTNGRTSHCRTWRVRMPCGTVTRCPWRTPAPGTSTCSRVRTGSRLGRPRSSVAWAKNWNWKTWNRVKSRLSEVSGQIVFYTAWGVLLLLMLNLGSLGDHKFQWWCNFNT